MASGVPRVSRARGQSHGSIDAKSIYCVVSRPVGKLYVL